MSVVQKPGGIVTLRCSVLPPHANISWHLNGRELLADDCAELGVVLKPGSLDIVSLSNQTIGRYQCVASTAVGACASVPANVTAASEYTHTHTPTYMYTHAHTYIHVHKRTRTRTHTHTPPRLRVFALGFRRKP